MGSNVVWEVKPTNLVHRGDHLYAECRLQVGICLDFSNTAIPNCLSLFALASAEIILKTKYEYWSDKYIQASIIDTGLRTKEGMGDTTHH
jgi:hypothetical protein